MFRVRHQRACSKSSTEAGSSGSTTTARGYRRPARGHSRPNRARRRASSAAGVAVQCQRFRPCERGIAYPCSPSQATASGPPQQSRASVLATPRAETRRSEPDPGPRLRLGGLRALAIERAWVGLRALASNGPRIVPWRQPGEWLITPPFLHRAAPSPTHRRRSLANPGLWAERMGCRPGSTHFGGPAVTGRRGGVRKDLAERDWRIGESCVRLDGEFGIR